MLPLLRWSGSRERERERGILLRDKKAAADERQWEDTPITLCLLAFSDGEPEPAIAGRAIIFVLRTFLGIRRLLFCL